LVIATLHAGSCKEFFERMLVMCRDSYAVLSVIDLVFEPTIDPPSLPGVWRAGCTACYRPAIVCRVPGRGVGFRLEEGLRRKFGTKVRAPFCPAVLSKIRVGAGNDGRDQRIGIPPEFSARETAKAALDVDRAIFHSFVEWWKIKDFKPYY